MDIPEISFAEKSETYLARHMIIPQVSSAALRLFPLGVLKIKKERGHQWAQTLYSHSCPNTKPRVPVSCSLSSPALDTSPQPRATMPGL